MRKTITVLALCMMTITPINSAEQTIPLKNPGFDQGLAGWERDQGASSHAKGKDGTSCLLVESKSAASIYVSQRFKVDGREVEGLKVMGFARGEHIVPGKEGWERARANLMFFDEKGEHIGGWPVVRNFEGSFDWDWFQNSLEVPREARAATINLGLQNCTGRVFFEHIKVIVDQVAAPTGKVASVAGREGWLAFKPKPYEEGSCAFDLSSLNHTPAGKHGFIGVRNGHFYFRDGTRARFWGVNVVASNCFPSHEEAEKLAKRLRRYGCNLVRLHHMDAFWTEPNIFDKSYDDTRHLRADSLERMDYLIYQLRQNGIYIFLDLIVNRKLKAGDGAKDWKGVDAGFKVVGVYDPHLIALQKEYAKNLYTHYNTYTKTRYIDEPAIMASEVVNEGSLYWIDVMGIPDYYLKELDGLFNAWLKGKHKSDAALKKAWGGALKRGESLAQGNVVREREIQGWKRKDRDPDARTHDTMQFYYELQRRYYEGFRDYLRSIGVKVPIAGSNHWTSAVADMAANAGMDFIDRHNYWDHPQGGYGDKVKFRNRPMVLDTKGSLIVNFASWRVKELPYTVSEWNCSWPNEYRLEGPLFMAAYSALHDWDALMQFDFAGGDWREKIGGNFDIGNKPGIFGLWPAAALIYRRNDVKAARQVALRQFSWQEVTGLANAWIHPSLALAARTEISFDADKGKELGGDDRGVYASTDGALRWDEKNGIFSLDTPRSKLAQGFLKGYDVLLKGMRLKTETDFCAVAVSSLDLEPIESGKRLLVSCAARAENTGTSYRGSRTRLTSAGQAPILREPVLGTLKLELQAAKVTVYPLDENGVRLRGSTAAVKDGWLELRLEGHMYYEVVVGK